MNWDEIKGRWDDVKGKVRSQWGKLSGDDLENIRGKREQLVAKIQQRYGIEKEEADRQVQDFLKRM